LERRSGGEAGEIEFQKWKRRAAAAAAAAAAAVILKVLFPSLMSLVVDCKPVRLSSTRKKENLHKDVEKSAEICDFFPSFIPPPSLPPRAARYILDKSHVLSGGGGGGAAHEGQEGEKQEEW
jgi:hypothetical protein